MRIWDLPPKRLCRQHLLGEHRELHAIWVVITKGKKGYASHPETMRWRGKLAALYTRHDLLVEEMTARGYHHRTPLSKKQAKGSKTQKTFVNSRKEQVEILKKKGCNCTL
jgi:hypothetical protein